MMNWVRTARKAAKKFTRMSCRDIRACVPNIHGDNISILTTIYPFLSTSSRDLMTNGAIFISCMMDTNSSYLLFMLVSRYAYDRYAPLPLQTCTAIKHASPSPHIAGSSCHQAKDTKGPIAMLPLKGAAKIRIAISYPDPFWHSSILGRPCALFLGHDTAYVYIWSFDICVLTKVAIS